MKRKRPPRYQILDEHSNDVGFCQHFRVTHNGVLITYGSWFIRKLAWAGGTWKYVIPYED